MSKFLQKIGVITARNPWKVFGIWLAILLVLGFGAVHYFKTPTSTITIPGTEAQVAIDRANELFPDSGKGSGIVVFKTKDTSTIEAHKADIDTLLNKINKTKGVAGVISPFAVPEFVAKDRQVAYARVPLENGTGQITDKTLQSITADINAARSNVLQIESGGDFVNKTPGDILGVGEIAGVVIALLVLVMTLGSLLAAGMPILTALLGIAVSTAGLFSLSQVVDISTTTPVLAVMLGLAVGIDYALFIINKYRTYLKAGLSVEKAIQKSLGTAGNAVVFAAITVIIALSALTIVNIPFMTTMGLAGAASIAVAAIATITVTPALLSLAGLRIFGKKARQQIASIQAKKPKHTAHRIATSSIWYKWGTVLVRRPVFALLAGLVTVGVIAAPIKDLQLGLPTDQHAAASSSERKAYDIIADSFGAGYNGPLVVVAEGLPAVNDTDKQAVRDKAMTEFNKQVGEAEAQQTAAFAAKAAQATTPEAAMALQQEMTEAKIQGEAQKAAGLQEIERQVTTYAPYVQLQKLADQIAKQTNVASAQPAVVAKDGTHGIVQVIPTSAPGDQQTTKLINTLRDSNTQKTIIGSTSATLAVTGSTAMQNDINHKLANALPTYLSVIIGLSLLLLLIAFRSIIVPLKATLGFVLSVLAMLGALVAVFQWGWFGIAEAPGPIISFIPIIATGILFGLAMDYEFFLVSGMHEAYANDKKKNAKQAVVRGFAMGGKVVMAAALIMTSVFAGFITNHDTAVQAIGFGLALGVFIDAFVVRMTIVPAIMSLMDRAAWWLPSWLEKRLPKISIEGEE